MLYYPNKYLFLPKVTIMLDHSLIWHCVQVGYEIPFVERRARWYDVGIFTGVTTKVQVPQKKNWYYC